ncbi:hypothetical protein SRRS_32960 [Sporomusa rhizae]|uniref:LysE family translocator n=1 Tax=Sporomusa rhizae TaxID=357999 RepID=UPI00352B0E11
MYYILFLKCVISGFLLAAPIGPVNLICIKSTLSKGRISGLIVGLGAATADALYGYAAAAGLNFLISFINQYETAFRWGGGMFIAYLGWKTFQSVPPSPSIDKETTKNLYKVFAGIFLLTLTNPITIFSFIATFSSLGIAILVTSLPKAALAALGVFLGSLLWWIILTSAISFFRDKVTPKTISYINKLAGALIILIGIASIKIK